MSDYLRKAIEALGFRQQAYRNVFAGSSMHLVLVDLAKYSHAFDADTAGISDSMLREMHGRRQMFFRIISHLKLTQQEMEQVYQPALVHAAQRFQQRGDENE